jgi:hypothetical protein
MSPSSFVPGVLASLPPSEGTTDALRDLDDGVGELATLCDDCLASLDNGVFIRAEAGVALGDLVVVPVMLSDSLSLIFLFGVEPAAEADFILAIPFLSFVACAGRFLLMVDAGTPGVEAAAAEDWSTEDALEPAREGSVLTLVTLRGGAGRGGGGVTSAGTWPAFAICSSSGSTHSPEVGSTIISRLLVGSQVLILCIFEI